MQLLKVLLLSAGCLLLAAASPFVLTSSLPEEFLTVPLADTSIDRYTLTHLVPSKEINLKYHDNSDPAGSLELNIAAKLKKGAIILENSIFIEQVHCSLSNDSISLQITDPAARAHFISSLSRRKNGVNLITKSKSCNVDSERGFYQQNGPVQTASSDKSVITVPVLQKDLKSLSKKLDVTYEYIPEDSASHSDLRRRDSTTQPPCKLQTGPSVASLYCNATGNLKSPMKTKFLQATNLDSCMQLCTKDATCMSFGWAQGLPNGQSCWTSVVSLTMQKFVQNKSSPWQLYDRDCFVCFFSTTSSTLSTSTKPTSTSSSSIKTTMTTTARISSTQSSVISTTSKSTSVSSTQWATISSSSPSQSSSTSSSKTTSLSSSQSTLVSSSKIISLSSSQSSSASSSRTTSLSSSQSTLISSPTLVSSATTTPSLPPAATTAFQSSLPLDGNGWQTDSNILPTETMIPLVYNSQAAVSSYTKLLKNLVYSSGTAQGSYVPPSTATAPAITFNPTDTAAQSSIVNQLISIGLEGPSAALSSLGAVATFAAPNIPANSPAPGQDELGGGSILPTGFPGSSSSKKRSLAQRSAEHATAKKRSIIQAPPPQILVRDAGDDVCDGLEVADDVCDALEGLEQPAVEIGCGLVSLANFGCEIRESWDALKCLFGGSCPGPAPPPPPIALTYAPTPASFSWSQPVNQTMWTDGTATVYCAQCSLNINSLGFSGTITVDPTSTGVTAGNILMSENSQRWLVLGLTTTGPSSGQQTFGISTPALSAITVGSIFSIVPSFSASFGLRWNINNVYTDIQMAGAQIGQPGSQIYSDFYTKQTAEQGDGKPGMRTFRPGLKPGDTMQTYAGTAASISYITAGQNLQNYVNTAIEYAISFNAQPSSSCGASSSNIAKQAYVTVNEDTWIGGTHTNLFSVSRQLADQCGFVGAVTAAPDGCGNQGAQYALFDMNSIAGSSINDLYTIDPSEQGVIDFIGGFSSYVNGGVSQGQSQNTQISLSSYGNSASFPYFQRIIVTQGYVFAPVTGTYTFAVNCADYAGNNAIWLFFGPATDPGIADFGKSDTYYLSPNLYGEEHFQQAVQTTQTLYMTEGSYYAYRMVIQLVQAYSDTSFSYDWQLNFPNGSTWLDANAHNSPDLVQYSCDGTSAPQFPSWADF